MNTMNTETFNDLQVAFTSNGMRLSGEELNILAAAAPYDLVKAGWVRATPSSGRWCPTYEPAGELLDAIRKPSPRPEPSASPHAPRQDGQPKNSEPENFN